jgi:hypothetical protein
MLFTRTNPFCCSIPVNRNGFRAQCNIVQRDATGKQSSDLLRFVRDLPINTRNQRSRNAFQILEASLPSRKAAALKTVSIILPNWLAIDVYQGHSKLIRETDLERRRRISIGLTAVKRRVHCFVTPIVTGCSLVGSARLSRLYTYDTLGNKCMMQHLKP